MVDHTEGQLDAAKEYAKSINDTSLEECLNRLSKVEANIKCQTNIYTDRAPYSFTFVRNYHETGHFAGNGGIIFHGAHDNGGDGSAPTFSVNVTPVQGWSIHT